MSAERAASHPQAPWSTPSPILFADRRLAIGHFGLLMHGDAPSRGVRHVLERGVPLQRDRRGAGDAALERHAVHCRRRREVALENLAVEIALFRLRRFYREALGGAAQHRVGDFVLGISFQRADPAIADTIGELLFLPPQYFVGNV